MTVFFSNLTYNANPFALTFAFAPSNTGNASKVKREYKPTHNSSDIRQTLPDFAMNVNRFGQPDCKLDSAYLRTDSKTAGNNQGFVASAGRTIKPLLYGTPILRRRAGDDGD